MFYTSSIVKYFFSKNQLKFYWRENDVFITNHQRHYEDVNKSTLKCSSYFFFFSIRYLV